MRFAAFIFLLFVTCNFENATALYGETVRLAKENEFPFVVGILNKKYVGLEENKIVCTGSLISREYVLTAAHCLDEGSDNLQVVVGTVDARSGEKYDVSGGIIFDKWVREKMDDRFFDSNDIAILKLSRKVANKNQKIAVLSAKSRYELVGKTATVSGWGAVQDGSASRYLRVAPVQVMETSLCEERVKIVKNYKYFILPSNIICSEGKATLGRGDSGGPLFMKENKLIGVNIMGCFKAMYEDPNQQNVYLAVDFYRNFISDILKNGDKYISSVAPKAEPGAASCSL